MKFLRSHMWMLVATWCVGVGSGCNALISRIIPPTPQHQNAQVFAETRDGWMLAIRRYEPAQKKPGSLPVVLCHGYGCNGTFWTLSEQNDFASYLRSKGYDTWVCDLRGMGQSHRKPHFGTYTGHHVNDEPQDGVDDWTVDDYAMTDVPTIIGKVKELTGAPKVCWIGHSMGGMIMYAYLVASPGGPANVHTFVALASPVFMLQPADGMLQQMDRSVGFLKIANIRGICRDYALLPTGIMPFDVLYYSRENVTELTVQRMYAYCMEDLPYGVSVQMNRMVETGDFWSANGKVNYSARLGTITIPMYFVGGKLDNMCPGGLAWKAYESVGSKDKAFIHFARANDYSADYGHCDLIWGKPAPREVFPKLAAWLDKHPVDSATRPSK